MTPEQKDAIRARLADGYVMVTSWDDWSAIEDDVRDLLDDLDEKLKAAEALIAQWRDGSEGGYEYDSAVAYKVAREGCASQLGKALS